MRRLGLVAALLVFLGGVLSACSSSAPKKVALPQPPPSLFSYAYIATSGPAGLYAMQTGATSATRLASLPQVAGSGEGLALDPQNGYLAAEGTNSLSLVKTSGGLVRSLKLGKLPVGICSDHTFGHVVAWDNLTASLLSLSGTTVSRVLSSQYPVQGIACAPNSDLILGWLPSSPGQPAQVVAIHASSASVSQPINVVDEPIVSIAFSPQGTSAYVLAAPLANQNGEVATVSVGLGGQLTISAALYQTDPDPTSIAVSPDGSLIAVGSSDGYIDLLSASTGQLLARTVARGPVTSVAFSSSALYVAQQNPSEILTYSIPGLNLLGETPAPGPVQSLLFDQSNGTLYLLTSSSAGQLLFYNPYSGEVAGAFSVGFSPTEVAGKIGQPFYVINTASATAQEFSGTNQVAQAALCPLPTAAVEGQNGNLYVSCSATGGGAGEVIELSSSSLSTLASVQVGVDPVEIAATPDGSKILVVNFASNTLTVLSSSLSPIASIPVGAGPSEVVVSADSRYAYVVNSQDNTLSVIDLFSDAVAHTSPINPYSQLIPDPSGENLFLLSHENASIYQVDPTTGTPSAPVTLPGNPVDAVVSPNGSQIVGVDDLSGSIFELSTSNLQPGALTHVKGEPTEVSISPDGSYALASDDLEGKLWLVKLSNLKLVRSFSLASQVSQVSFQAPKAAIPSGVKV